MKIKKIIATLLLTVFFISSTFAGQKFAFPGLTSKLKSKDLCGVGNCKPGNGGIIFIFSKDVFTPEINKTSTQEEVALSILGHTVKQGDTSGSFPVPCSETGISPFSADDITQIGITGHKVKYEKKSTLNLNIGSVIEANLKEIRKEVTDPLKLQKAEAKIKFAYEKINGKELKVNAFYTEWGLKNSAISQMRAGTKFQDCKTFIKSRPYRVITAIGLVQFQMTYDGNSVDTLANEIASQLESDLGYKGSFSLIFKKQVTKEIEASIDNGFVVPVWRHRNDFDL